MLVHWIGSLPWRHRLAWPAASAPGIIGTMIALAAGSTFVRGVSSDGAPSSMALGCFLAFTGYACGHCRVPLTATVWG